MTTCHQISLVSNKRTCVVRRLTATLVIRPMTRVSVGRPLQRDVPRFRAPDIHRFTITRHQRPQLGYDKQDTTQLHVKTLSSSITTLLLTQSFFFLFRQANQTLSCTNG
jgi:hypothetical protein